MRVTGTEDTVCARRLQLAAYRMIQRLVGLDLPAFATRREALDWLAERG